MGEYACHGKGSLPGHGHLIRNAMSDFSGYESRMGLLLAGDVIVGLEGKKITRASDLVTALDDFSIGDKVSLTIQRGVGQQQVRHKPLEASRGSMR